MPSSPKVSCLVVTYNQQDVVRETIDSILAQTYNNLEIVIADDGSTDNTPEILEEYQKQYPDKIKIITGQKNFGVTLNSKRAYDLCTGDFIAIIGGDDIWLPEKIEKQIEWFQSHPEAVICYHDIWAFDSKSGNNLYRFTDTHAPLIGTIKDVIYGSCFAGACSVMLRVITDIPLRFDKRILHGSDWHTILCYLLDTNKKIGFIPKIYSRYRRNNNNLSQTNIATGELIQCYDLIAEDYPTISKKAHLANTLTYFSHISQACKNRKFSIALNILKQSGIKPRDFVRAFFVKLKLFVLRRWYILRR
jgi:glycosyltransferase involved in cell wall biosynthesis